MIRNGVLFALAQAVDAGLLEAAEMHMRRVDPLLRPWTRRSLRRAIADARAKTTLEAHEHILRVAFLLACGAPRPADFDDEAQVSAAYRPLVESRFRNRVQVWPASLAIVAVVLGCVSFPLIRYFLPTGEQRFRRTALGEALQTPLSQWVVAMNADEQKPASILRWALLSPFVRAQVGAKPSDALRGVLDTAEAVHSSRDPNTETAFAPLMNALNLLNSSLASRHVPAYLTGYSRGAPGRRVVWLASYYARKRDDVAVGDTHAQATWGVRLDSLNLADSVAFKLDAEDATLLSLDRIEEDFVRNWLRPAGRGEAMAEAATLSRDGPTGVALARSAGPVIGKEIADAAHLSQEDARTIASLLDNRNAAASELIGRGYVLPLHEQRLSLDRGTATGLEHARGREPPLDPLIEEVLKQDALLTSFTKSVSPAVDILAALVEEEFVAELAEAHRLRDVSVPALAEHEVDQPLDRARASAELAKLARPQACPKLALWRTARLAFSDEYGSDEQEVGIIVLDALFGELGLPRRAIWGGQGLDGSDLPKALEDALGKSPSEIRDAATRAYGSIFHAPPPRFVRREL